jgi:hypothetical protein
MSGLLEITRSRRRRDAVCLSRIWRLITLFIRHFPEWIVHDCGLFIIPDLCDEPGWKTVKTALINATVSTLWPSLVTREAKPSCDA